MLQWKARFIVLLGTLALIAATTGGAKLGGMLHFGWN
jgi:hypothetical protein